MPFQQDPTNSPAGQTVRSFDSHAYLLAAAPASNVVFGRVVGVHLDERFIDADGRLDTAPPNTTFT